MILIYLQKGTVERVAVDCTARVDPVFVFNVDDSEAEPEIKLSDPMTRAERTMCIEGRK